MKLLVVIPFCANNAPQAERLLDWIYQLSGRDTVGHVLLAADPDVHIEMRQRIRISASLAFEGVHELDIRPLADTQARKAFQVNSVFRQCAEHIAATFAWPWLWLEPDCVPTKCDWQMQLQVAYDYQPKAFLGEKLKAVWADKTETFFMGRVGIYPAAGTLEIIPSELKGAFEIAAGNRVVPRMTITKLVQQVSIQTADDLNKVLPDASLVHGDKNGYLLRKIESEWAIPLPPPPPSDTIVVPPIAPPVSEAVAITTITKRRGRPTKAEIAARTEAAVKLLNGTL